MQFTDIQTIIADHQKTGQLYHEFLRVPALSMGLYLLAAGSEDPQNPHTEDEVYYVVSGKGQFYCKSQTGEVQDVAVEQGSLLYVEAHAVHKFHSITEDLQILVFFAPAENE
ncbi:MAG: cupin domain-containing protein [Chloroflexota bacterium]